MFRSFLYLIGFTLVVWVLWQLVFDQNVQSLAWRWITWLVYLLGTS